MSTRCGPLQGLRVLELGGIGPGPFAAMLLADLGAEVIRVDRTSGHSAADRASHRVLHRGRRSVGLDLKDRRAVALVLSLVERCDALLEGFRPGVAERLGLGPEAVQARNPALVYGRMTGWGQDGPLATSAGHDINYIALAGALEPIAAGDGVPIPPLNMLGDFGGGGMLMALGLVSALLNARETGVGQVVDAAIVDGTALLTGMLHSMLAAGMWAEPRGENLFDGGAPYYRVYATADDRWLAVGAIEPPFYAQLVAGLGLAEELAEIPQTDVRCWADVRARIAARVAERTRDEWMAVFAGTDACVSEALAPSEVADHPHLVARGTFVRRDGHLEPAPAPRFSRTPTGLPEAAPAPGADSVAVLAELGLSDAEIDGLISAGVVAPA
jgi:alpha-methylacyl-CoA racemase